MPAYKEAERGSWYGQFYYYEDWTGKRNKWYMMQSHVTPYLGKKKMNETTPADIIA